jgi:hypothetical protein
MVASSRNRLRRSPMLWAALFLNSVIRRSDVRPGNSRFSDELLDLMPERNPGLNRIKKIALLILDRSGLGTNHNDVGAPYGLIIQLAPFSCQQSCLSPVRRYSRDRGYVHAAFAPTPVQLLTDRTTQYEENDAHSHSSKTCPAFTHVSSAA